LLYVPVATNCCVVPRANDGFAGVTAIETKAAGNPVPLDETVCGLLFALSTKLNVPSRVPVVVGEKLTDTVQLAPAASLLGLSGQVETRPKSAKLLVTFVIVNAVD